MEWANATRVGCRKPTDSHVLYETSKRDDIAALATALRFTPSTGEYCMCIGTLVFEIDGVSVTLHHGESLRWEGSGGNAALVDPDAVMDWLSARGVTFVREEFEAAKARADEDALDDARWIAAMPSSLRPFFEDMRQSGDDTKPEWTAAIEAQFPDLVMRTREMLALYGSGTGRYTGYPSYESVPLRLIDDLPFDVLVAAIGEAPRERVCAGTVRLLCSWNFRKRRRKLVAKLSEPARTALLAHAQTLPDETLEEAISALTDA